MKIIIAKKTWLANSDLRLDASYHLSDGQLTLTAFKKANMPTEPLKQVTERIFYGGRSRRVYVKNIENGLPFIKGADIVKADFFNLKIISRKRTVNLNEYFLKEGWTVITRSGTIGNTAYVNKDFIGKAASDDIIRVVPKTVPSGFLYAFLSSKNGKALLAHGTYGAVIQHIEPEHIENIPIPIFPNDLQQQIHDLITESAELKVEANRLLGDAISLFENRIGITNVRIATQDDTVKIGKLRNFLSRFDAQYQIITQKLDDERSTSFNYVKISNIAKRIFVGNRAKRNYVVDGIPFLSSSDMMLFNPKRYAKQISKRTPSLDSLLVNRSDILISRSGTVGNVVLVGDDLVNSAVSEHALRLEIDDTKMSPEYIFCYLKTKQGKAYMEVSAFGSVIITLNEELIGNIEVPILNDNDRETIISKIKIYIEKLDLATLKENQAIQLVEKEIEQWQN